MVRKCAQQDITITKLLYGAECGTDHKVTGFRSLKEEAERLGGWEGGVLAWVLLEYCCFIKIKLSEWA